MLLSAKSTLEKAICDILSCVNLKVIFRIKNRLSCKFAFKDKISKEMCSLICYFAAMLLNMVKPNITVRFKSLNIWKSLHAGKVIKSTKNSAVHHHMLVCDNIVFLSVVANGTNDFRIKLQETLLIHCDGP